MTKEHKSVTESLKFWDDELKHFESLLKARGILNFEDHSGYVALKDKVGVLEFFGKISKNLTDMRKKIRQVFRDDIEGIVLSTVHKAKGLESDRVFIARPDKLPLPASTKWQADQEINLEYVAITRAKNELIYDWEWTDDEEDVKEEKEKLKKRRK
jgi:superfamily I DNA/RNA helicase